MSQSIVFIIVVLVIVFAIIVSSYFHKRHLEYKMEDIEKAINSAYGKDVRSIKKEVLIKGVKMYFHCSTKEAHYIIGVARRKKIIDISASDVTLLQ